MNENYHDMDIEDYHLDEAISATNMKDIEISCELAVHNQKHGSKKTVPKFEGNLIHHAVEFKETGSKYALAPECDRRTKAGKAIYAEFQERLSDRVSPISKQQYEMAHNCMEAAWSHPESKLFLKEAKFERSGFCELMGVEVKARPDLDCTHIKGLPLVDIKTRQLGRASQEAWQHDFWTSHTYLQAGLQILVWRKLGIEVNDYFYILVEREPPYQVNVVGLDPESITYAILGVHNILEKWKNYLANGLPRSYGLEQKLIETPEWIKRKFNR